ncbi:UNVERIFIED_CONTAM: hypothetical protein Slati_4192900 [Sesamum latifolium]|uniref:Reverse transcriptase zinc-binding domain-containing protein n=1 Tax=Sesamum latifolium TaxID=2727402 RepID=A0AAW2TA70_9LAMI
MTLVFCQASHEVLQSVGHILIEFEVASGLMVNLEKSSVAFSRNVPKNLKNDLASVLGIRVVTKHERYLGFPALVGRSKREIFQTLKDRVWAKMQSWRCRNLSQAGKATAGPGSSFTWRSILAARELILVGMRWHIETGQGVRIWKDKWIPRPLSFQVVMTPNTLGEDVKVEELFDSEGGWKEELLHFVFLPMDVDIIVGINRAVGIPDSLRWHYEKNGRYLVKSVYCLMTNGAHTQLQSGPIGATLSKSDSWSFIWQAAVPPKIRLFAWRASPDSLPTSSNLQKQGAAKDGICPW